MQKCFLIAWFFICADCFAQQYPFVHYTPKDGLINSRVRKAYQDSKGRMYFMTFGGLSVYDGARFKNYTTQNGLLSDLVNDVLEVGDDSLLVAVNTCGLNVLVRGKMRTSRVNSKACPVINQLLKTKEGTIYASADDGLYKLGAVNFEKLSVFFSQPIEFLGAITEYKDFIIFTTNDLRDYKGLFLYHKKTNKITDALPQFTIWSLKSDHHGIIWVGAAGGMHNLDTAALASGRLVLRHPYTSFISETPLALGTINFNHRNEPFIMTGKEIIRYSADKPPLYITTPDISSFIQVFFIDREDIIWICHDGNGVYKLPNTNLQSTKRFFEKNKSGISNVRAFKGDSLWIVMNDGQWILYSSSTSESFRTDPLFKESVTLLACSRANLYAVSRNRLYRAQLPEENEKIIRFKKIVTLPGTRNFGGESVYDPYGNNILFETDNICVIRNDKQIFGYPFSVFDLIEGMYIDKNNRLWVVSRGSGLMIFSFHPEDQARYLQKEFQYINEFETASPRCMAADKDEILWVGTRYHGLMGFEYKNNQLKKLHHFQTPNGLTDNFVTSLACDDNNNVIIGTQTGVDRLVKIKDGSYRLENITKSNNIFAFIDYVWTDASNTSFALTNSGVVFRVEPIFSNTTVGKPQLLIEEMKVNGKSISPDLSPQQLKYYQRNISFGVAAPTFIDERQVKYSYLLSGSGNNEWSDTTPVADINLLNLSPGSYTLRVKAFFHSTAYPSIEKEFSFQILPPWWQTVLFRLIAATCIMGLLIIVTRFYYRRKLQQQRILLEKQQAIEKERTRIATDMHDDLGAGLSRIKFLSETIGIKKQKQLPIEEDITKIREYSHEMIDKMGEIVWALNEKNDSLSDLLSYTRSYAAEYLSQNGIECTVSLPEQLSSAFVSGEIRRNVFLAVKEILHNVVKHSQAN
ncbi:MAG TPA: histidine kinase, partial [Chitinophagaceae bacterium]|nr:histidine kinase [Chitinophagaceae bacterium]